MYVTMDNCIHLPVYQTPFTIPPLPPLIETLECSIVKLWLHRYLYVVSVRRLVIGIESWIEDTKETPRWVTVGCPSSCRLPDGTTVVKIQHQWPNPSQRRVRFHLVPYYLILHSRCCCSRSWMGGVWLLVKNPFDFPVSVLCVPVS